MGRIKDEKLFKLIHDYFALYLPNHKSASIHTIRSYQNSINSFMDYLKEQNNTSLFDITFEMITAESVHGYIEWLKNDKGLSLSTCKNRLAALKAFLKYCSSSDATQGTLVRAFFAFCNYELADFLLPKQLSHFFQCSCFE